ncbi:MAG: ABC transporter substrate-binding protein [Candidatus Rokuibacteriota bacterium]|nr:MAG: ABC transporter substrate-binding protein [Candidatus Rokubacteria bacterium]
MKRRVFLGLMSGAVMSRPLTAGSQPTTRPVVGFLNSASSHGYASMAHAFRQGLTETGYIEPALAAELVSRRVAVIFANGPSAVPAKATTSTIPIVFMHGDDPVRLGLVASFNRPGGNVTGVTILSGELAAKRLEFLRGLLPRARQVAVLINGAWSTSARFQADIEAAAPAQGVALRFLQANNDREIESAFDTLSQIRADALLVGPGPFLDSRRDLLVARAAKSAIPAAYETRATAVAGGLMSYGASVANGYRQAGIYVGRVLKGEKPANLPVLQPTVFELVINMKTARALGLTVPPKLLAVAR